MAHERRRLGCSSPAEAGSKSNESSTDRQRETIDLVERGLCQRAGTSGMSARDADENDRQQHRPDMTRKIQRRSSVRSDGMTPADTNRMTSGASVPMNISTSHHWSMTKSPIDQSFPRYERSTPIRIFNDVATMPSAMPIMMARLPAVLKTDMM